MRFPQPFIEDLKRQADIVRIVQDYVSLKKKGANWMACCPFHKEKTASFSVSPAKDIFYCFGCHKGGSVFNFVMEIERVAFPDAVRIVAEKSGVPLPKMIEGSRVEGQRRESDDVIQLNKWALEWWEQQLEGAEARIARDYLLQRQITDETRKTFRLGYAPDSWDALSFYLRGKGASQLQIERSGLVVKKEAGGSYDRFRGRLIFPVMDIQSRPIAFGARTLKNEDAKYINSPETAAYVKGRYLFGLNLTRDEIRRRNSATLVEGYLDLIAPYQLGVRNIVASLGTALTPEQAKLISRFARTVLVNYDGDRAGVQAAKRAIETLLAEGLQVDVLSLDNADPDEFIRKEGVEQYRRERGEGPQDYSRSAWNRAAGLVRAQARKLEHQEDSGAAWRRRAGVENVEKLEELGEAGGFEKQGGTVKPHMRFVIDQAVRDRNLSQPSEKAQAVEEVLPFIRAVPDPIEKREYFDIAMDSLLVQSEQRRELWYQIRRGGNVDASVVQKLITPNIQPTVAEERLLGLLLANEELRKIVLPRLEGTDYEDLATASIFRALVKLDKDGKEINFDSVSDEAASDALSPDLLPRLMMNETAESFDESMMTADRCVDALRLMKLDRRIDELSSEVAEAERAGDDGRRDRVALELLKLSRQRSSFLPQTQTNRSLH